MIKIRDELNYNLKLNQIARLPITSTFIGTARILVNLAALVYHVGLALLHKNDPLASAHEWIRAKQDVRGLGRGLIELIPILGGIGSWYIDTYCLTPAQRVAYRVQEIYQKRIKADNWITRESDLVDLDLKKCTPSVLEFINNQKVKVSNNQNQIDLFCTQFNQGNVEHGIFNDKKLPFYALAALVQGKIDQDDMATIMEIYTAKQCFADCHVFRALDNLGNWTQAAQDALPDKTESTKFLNYEKQGSLEKFSCKEVVRKQLAKLPAKKQLMWTHECIISQREIASLKAERNESFQEIMYSPVGSLAAGLAYIEGTKESQKGRQVGLSFHMERLFLNARYKTSNDPLIPRLGLFSPKNIQSAVEYRYARLCATAFPGTPRTLNLHNSLELPTTVIAHDKIHAQILQQYPAAFIELIQALRMRFKDVTGFTISKETWELVELVAPECFSMSDLPSLLNRFCKDKSARRDELSFYELMHNEDNSPSPLLWMLLLLVKEKLGKVPYEFWKEAKAIDNLYHLQESYSMKQKLWILSQLYAKKPIEKVPSNEELTFEKHKKGHRKNTVFLKHIQTNQIR